MNTNDKQSQPNANQPQPGTWTPQYNTQQYQNNASTTPQKPGQYQQYAGQYQQYAGQYQQNAGQYQQKLGQYQQYAGQYQHKPGQYQQYAGQYQQYAGQYQQNAGQYRQKLGQYQQFADPNQQKPKKTRKIFQPKVIIGSIVTFITGAIGVIAVFFPSLFNLETKKIDNLTLFVHTENDSKKLYDFLKSHENGIVNLNIAYVNYEKVYDLNSGSNIATESDFESGSSREIKYFDNTVIFYVGKSKHIVKLTEEEITSNKFMFLMDKLEEKHKQPEKKYYFSPTGKNKLFSVISEIDLAEHWEYLYRENGGFGFWNPSMKINEKNDSESGDLKLEFAFQIAIPHKTKSQKLYKWGLADESWNKIKTEPGATLESLSGTFFVNPEAPSLDIDFDIHSYMHPMYAKKFQIKYLNATAAPDFFLLDPIAKKELEFKNY